MRIFIWPIYDYALSLSLFISLSLSWVTFALYLQYARYAAFRHSCTAKYHHVKYLVFRSHILPLYILHMWKDVCMCVTSHNAHCTHWARKNMKIKISYRKTIRAHSLAAYSTNGKITTRCFAEYICRLCRHIFCWTSCHYCLLPSLLLLLLLRLRLPLILLVPSEHQTSNNTMVEVTLG